jgi:hypothetical protein
VVDLLQPRRNLARENNDAMKVCAKMYGTSRSARGVTSSRTCFARVTFSRRHRPSQ